MKVEERVALVTGASSGLGDAIARRLAVDGWAVGLVARRRERLEALAEEIERNGGSALVEVGDVTDSAFLETALNRLSTETGRLDLLVNNAGGVTASSGALATDAEFEAVLALNVRAVYRLCCLAAPHLEKTGGSIVNIGSAAVARTLALDLPYLASKAALEAMSRGMAKSWGGRGVRVNTVAPGVVPTEALVAVGLTPEEASARYASLAAATQVIERTGGSEDIAAAVTYLASSEAGFITGATLHVDGGMAVGG